MQIADLPDGSIRDFAASEIAPRMAQRVRGHHFSTDVVQKTFDIAPPNDPDAESDSVENHPPTR